MFIGKKIYCRISQFVFWLAIPFLPYSNPTLLDSTEKLPDELKRRGIDSVIIITDKSIHGFGLVEPLKRALEKQGIRYVVYDKTVPNPTIDNVEEALKLYHENHCQGLIGFGGGSPIDCAKITGARVVRPRMPVNKMSGVFKIFRRLPFVAAIPTTAGTGSEVTASALITDGKTRHKFPINDLMLIPKVSVLDPEVTRSLPKHITASTGMDALTHAVEAYIGRSTVKSTRADALEAVRLISQNLLNAYNDGDDLTARKNMLMGSFLAGRAFAKSYVGYCHAVAHSLGGRYNLPHGLANAVLLPYVLDAYGDTVYKKLKTLGIAAGVCAEQMPERAAAETFIAWIREMNRSMDIPTKLKGIRAEDIPTLARIADKEGNPFYPVPKLMDARELEQFYYDVMEA